MSLSQDRARARLGDITFQFKFPILDVQATGRKVEHEVLPVDSTDTGQTVVQPLGEGKTTGTLRGSVSRSEAKALDGLEGDVVELRHPRRSGDVFIAGVDTRSQQARKDGEKLYEFTADLIFTT
jgi:hypothetical protein